MPKALELTGQRFSRLFVLKAIKERKDKHIVWKCRCDCGNIKKIRGSHLTSGHIKSCGCLQKENQLKAGLVHGHTLGGKPTKTYRTWIKMNHRCNNPNHISYKYYGGRGIKVCERWLKFENFLEDMGERPKGLTIDREDNDGNYEPGNCRWATHSQQMNNRRCAKA